MGRDLEEERDDFGGFLLGSLWALKIASESLHKVGKRNVLGKACLNVLLDVGLIAAERRTSHNITTAKQWRAAEGECLTGESIRLCVRKRERGD